MSFDPAARTAIPTPADADLAAIRETRDAFVDADNAGDTDAMVRLLADDIVILHPYCGAFDGKDAVRTFMGRVLGEVHAEFDKQASYSTIELTVSGDFAFERGELRQRLTPKAGGPATHDAGMYLWIYAKRDGAWQIARIAGTFTTAAEPTDGPIEEGT
jgi:uncharacterized protein (TIGR02246 family)